jgi:DNA-binding response OmpR family regulator
VHVVDDDAAFRTAIERRLKQAGYEVTTYPSAQHLLDRLPSETEVGCILLDVRIPDLSGTELQDRLRELGSTLPIIFLTGYPDIRLTVQTIRAGAEDFLIKPVSSDLLLQAIERAVARHKMSRDRKAIATVWRCPRDVRFPSDSGRNVAPRPPVGPWASKANAQRSGNCKSDPVVVLDTDCRYHFQRMPVQAGGVKRFTPRRENTLDPRTLGATADSHIRGRCRRL